MPPGGREKDNNKAIDSEKEKDNRPTRKKRVEASRSNRRAFSPESLVAEADSLVFALVSLEPEIGSAGSVTRGSNDLENTPDFRPRRVLAGRCYGRRLASHLLFERISMTVDRFLILRGL